jgi:hypothetical protein
MTVLLFSLMLLIPTVVWSAEINSPALDEQAVERNRAAVEAAFPPLSEDEEERLRDEADEAFNSLPLCPPDEEIFAEQKRRESKRVKPLTMEEYMKGVDPKNPDRKVCVDKAWKEERRQMREERHQKRAERQQQKDNSEKAKGKDKGKD